MLVSPKLIESLALRVERAYKVRRPEWDPGRSSPRVWAAAAANLIEAQRNTPALPLDPELFVASQPVDDTFGDPWNELTHPRAARRYRAHVRQIVRGLNAELKGEIRRAERQIVRGAALEDVVLGESRSLSPLGRFLIAQRAGRRDLADLFRAGARIQHQSCPLYRQACSTFLAAELYPGEVSSDAIRPSAYLLPPQLLVLRN